MQGRPDLQPVNFGGISDKMFSSGDRFPRRRVRLTTQDATDGRILQFRPSVLLERPRASSLGASWFFAI
jgi:hypothetical protein